MVVGFKDEAALVRAAAARLGADAAFAVEAQYPSGEIRVVGPAKVTPRVTVAANVVERPASLFRLLLLAEALSNAGAKRVDLIAPWIAYGRQDRVTVGGEAPAGLLVANLLSRAFNHVSTLDAHSQAFVRAFKGRLSNAMPLTTSVKRRDVDLVAAPDAGAKTRALRFARMLKVPLVLIEKNRRAGRVTSQLLSKSASVKGRRVLLIDDIVDTGGTLFSAAAELNKAGARSVSAFVTHGTNLPALKKNARGRLDRVEVVFDHGSGALLPSALSVLTASAAA